MSHRRARLAIRGAERLVGRRRLAQAARLLTNEVRLDGPNDMAGNGEELVQRLARTVSDPVVLDVGCHFGEWSAELLKQPGAVPELHAFEPSAISFHRAVNTLRGRGEVHQLGLSDHPGSADLIIVHPGAGSNSVVPFAKERLHAGAVEEIALSTVDIFCLERGLSHVTLLKIDAEGHDLAVLRGASQMLTGQAISLIQFEYNARWIDARRFLLDAFNLLSASGYELGKVTPRGIEIYDQWHPELESFREANYLAFLPAWKDRLPTLPWWGG